MVISSVQRSLLSLLVSLSLVKDIQKETEEFGVFRAHAHIWGRELVSTPSLHTHTNVHSFLLESRRQSTQAFTGTAKHTRTLPAYRQNWLYPMRRVTVFDHNSARELDAGTSDRSNPTMQP